MTQDDSWSVRASFKDWAWVILLVGGALGTTLPGQLLLLLVFVIEGLSRLVRRSSDGPDFEVRDLSFARLGWAFFLASLISAGFSEHPTMALAISTGFLLLFGIVALGTKSFVLSPLLERPDRLVAWILVAGVAGSLYGIYGVVELGHSRAVGLGSGANGFGGLNALLAIVATGYAVQKGRAGWWLATIPVYLVTLTLTMSRGSWLGFVASVVVFAVIVAFGKIRDKRYLKWMLILLVVAALISASLFVTRPALQARLASLLSLDRNDARILIWQTAVEMIKDRPLTGVGGGVFPLVYNEYRLDSGTKAFSFAHNLPLQIFAEFGLLGFIPFAGMVGLALVRGWRLAWRSGPLIISIYAGFIGMLVHDMVDNVTYGMNLGGLFWFLMGFLVHLERKLRLQGNTL